MNSFLMLIKMNISQYYISKLILTYNKCLIFNCYSLFMILMKNIE